MSFFDPAKIDDTEFELLPNGTYKVLVDSCAYKPTKLGTGHYMAVTFSCQDPKFMGRKIFGNYNMQNPSEQAQKIGLAQFKKLCTAIGITQALKSPDEFSAKAVNKLLWLDVVGYEDDGGKNRLKIMKYIAKTDIGSQPPKPTNSRTHDEPPPPGDDDMRIPF